MGGDEIYKFGSSRRGDQKGEALTDHLCFDNILDLLQVRLSVNLRETNDL